MKRSNVVYSIPCSNCNGIYVGQTGRTLQSRITSHKSDIKLKHRTCSLADHSIGNGHSPNFDDTKIIVAERSLYKRQFLEMVAINNTQNSLNKRSDIQGLNNIYCYLLHLEYNRSEDQHNRSHNSSYFDLDTG